MGYLTRSGEIPWDYMRLLHARQHRVRQGLKRTLFNPSSSHPRPCASSVTLRKSLGNPVGKSGLRIAVSRVGIQPNFSRMLLNEQGIVVNRKEKICDRKRGKLMRENRTGGGRQWGRRGLCVCVKVDDSDDLHLDAQHRPPPTGDGSVHPREGARRSCNNDAFIL